MRAKTAVRAHFLQNGGKLPPQTVYILCVFNMAQINQAVRPFTVPVKQRQVTPGGVQAQIAGARIISPFRPGKFCPEPGDLLRGIEILKFQLQRQPAVQLLRRLRVVKYHCVHLPSHNQLRYLPGQRRLCDVQLPCRPGDIFLSGHRQKIFQYPQLHKIPP